MIEVVDMYGAEDVIVTKFYASNVMLNKEYKLKKKEREMLLLCFRLYQQLGITQLGANEVLVEKLHKMTPHPMWNYRRYRMFQNILFDVEQIFMSNNVEFNLVRYFTQVCGLSFKQLGSDDKDCYVRQYFRKVLPA